MVRSFPAGVAVLGLNGAAVLESSPAYKLLCYFPAHSLFKMESSDCNKTQVLTCVKTDAVQVLLKTKFCSTSGPVQFEFAGSTLLFKIRGVDLQTLFLLKPEYLWAFKY